MVIIYLIFGIFKDFSSQISLIMVGYLLGFALKYIFLLVKFYKAFKLAFKLSKVEELQFNKISEICFSIFWWILVTLFVDSRLTFLKQIYFASCDFPIVSVRLLLANFQLRR